MYQRLPLGGNPVANPPRQSQLAISISNGPGRFKIGFFFFFHGQFEMSDKLFGLTCCNALLRNTGLPNSIFSLSLFFLDEYFPHSLNVCCKVLTTQRTNGSWFKE